MKCLEIKYLNNVLMCGCDSRPLKLLREMMHSRSRLVMWPQRWSLLRPIHTGRRRQGLLLTLNGVTSSVAELNCGSVASLHWRCWRQKLKTFQLFKRQRRRQPIRSPYANTLAQTLANPVHATPEKYVIGCCHYDGASAPSFRHALRQALTPTPRVNAA